MATVSLKEAQTCLPELIHKLQPGEELIITENDAPVACLSAARSARKQPRRAGSLRGTVLYMAPDFAAPLDDFKGVHGVKLLVDSQALIWFVDQDQLLGPSAHAAISDPDNELLLSAASIWEIAIKVGLTKLRLSMSYREWMERAISDLDLVVLPITVAVADAQANLPWHHRDPFDRLVIAHALVEGVSVASSDAIFDRYDVDRVW